MSVLIIEEKPPHFTDVEFEYKGIEFKAQICLFVTVIMIISFRVPKHELEQNLCKGLFNSRGTKLDIKIKVKKKKKKQKKKEKKKKKILFMPDKV